MGKKRSTAACACLKSTKRRLRLPEKKTSRAPLAPALAGANGMNATEATQHAMQSQAVIRLENEKNETTAKTNKKEIASGRGSPMTFAASSLEKLLPASMTVGIF